MLECNIAPRYYDRNDVLPVPLDSWNFDVIDFYLHPWISGFLIPRIISAKDASLTQKVYSLIN